MTTPYPGNQSWPSDWDKATFHGRLIDILGTPATKARLYLKPNVSVGVITSIGSDAVVLPIERQVVVDPVTSEFSVDIPGTDDPQVSPTGWTYQVRIATGIPGVPDLTFPMTAPVGTVVELKNAAKDAQVIPGTGVPIVTAYQYARSKGYAGTESDFATMMATGVGGGGGITQVTDAVVASNAAISLAKTADGGGRLAMTAAERTSLAQIPSQISTLTTSVGTKADLSGGKVPSAQLGGAGADSTKVLYGDLTWKPAPTGGGGGGPVTVETLPSGSMVAVTADSRPTSRTDIVVVYYTAAQPTTMLSTDRWVVS